MTSDGNRRLFDHSVWWPALDATQHARIRSDARIRVLAADAVICHQGKPADAWIGVADGLVKLCATDSTGRSATLAGVPSGGWFGEGSLFKDEPRRYQAIALRESRIAYVPRATFHWLLDNSIGFNRFVIYQLNERLGQFIGSLEHQRLLTPEGRLARCLAQMFNPFLFPGVDPTLSFSQTELGLLTGLSRQRVNQALQTLEAAGLVKVQYGAVTVDSLDGLRSYPDPPGVAAGDR